MTVLQIVPALDAGGAERSAIEIAEALKAAGHHALIAAKPGRWSAWAARSAEVIPLALGRKSPLVMLDFFALRRLLSRVDIVHTRSRLPSWLTWLALKTLPAANGLHSVSRYSAIQHAGECAIAVSQTARDYVHKHYPKTHKNAPLTVIERGANTELFYPGQNTRAWRAEFDAKFPNLLSKQLLLLAGRGTRLKGHLEALNLFADLRARGMEVALFFAGIVEEERASYLDEVKRACAKLDLTDHTVFSEARQDLPALYAHAALVLQLSNRPESFGRTVAEALLCGANVLGFDHGGVGEQLHSAFPAGLVPLGNRTLLADRAQELLVNPQAPDVSKVATVAQMQAKTLSCYQALLRR
jgi:glycosyltransferase involved in cell wall biosynthesis